MKIHDSNGDCKPGSRKKEQLQTPQELASELKQLAETFQAMASKATQTCESFDQTERAVFECILKMGFLAMQQFVSLQGDGDLGPDANTDGGKTLVRSEEPARTKIRSIFGEHAFDEFTYSLGKNKTIQLRPISARMQVPATRWSFLLEEFSQMFCVEQAFNQASDNLQTVFGSNFSVQTLEHVSGRVGKQADTFLDDLPQPDPASEGKLLVASADGKGVPLVKKDAAKVAAFETAKSRPGNRKMATVASVYSVDRYDRSAQSVVEALFRDEKAEQKPSDKSGKRPEPQNKNTTAHFPSEHLDGSSKRAVSGTDEAMSWISDQVDSRRQKNQTLIVHMDGQISLWAAVLLYLGTTLVPILDFLHVAIYVWEAAALFYKDRDEKERFARSRLLRLLQGDVEGVIRGLRRMGTIHKLRGEKLKTLSRICGYFEKNKQRMRYDVYLKQGYPIATGVIEGACRHLVKDRMERTGMRWTLEGARSMLNVRAVFQSDHWKTFHQQRIRRLTEETHPHRNMIGQYTPLTLAS